jgi:hypothetical protein
MQIPIKSKIPKIISGILATTILISLGFSMLPSFWFWILFEIFAAILVAGGCCGEWWLHYHPAGRKKKDKDEHHKLESRFIAMVALGVIMELFALGHSIREGVKLEIKVSKANERAANSESNSVQVLQKVGELNKEAADARKDAGDALKFEAIANARASEFDAARAKFENEAELTRSNNLVLQKQLQPRIITLTQITNFIFLTDRIPKIPIRVGLGKALDEPLNYAYQIQSMLLRAGFKIPDSDTNFLYGIHTDETAVNFIENGYLLKKYPDVQFIMDNTNNFSAYTFSIQNTNGLSQPIVSANDTNGIYAALNFVFNEIGILSVWGYKPEWAGTNHIEIFVMQKSQ